MLKGNNSQVTTHVALLIQPTPQDLCPPEKSVILAAVAALPEGEYCIFDEQEDSVPQWLHCIPEVQAAAWGGGEQGSFGYGGTSVAATSYGPVLRVWLGGSTAQSATGFWIVPAKAAEVAARE